MKINMLLASTALVLLAACGGSNGTRTATESLETPAVERESFESFVANIDEDFDTALDGLDLEQTEEADLKVSGSAEYIGVLAVGEFDAASEDVYLAIGEASVLVDFETNNVSGSASNFFEIDLENSDFESDDGSDVIGTAIDGEFSVATNGQSLTGTLTHLSGDEVSYDLDVDSATYFGENQENLSVDGFGTASNGADAGFFFDGFDASLLD